MIFLPAQNTFFFFCHLDISVDIGLLLNKSLVTCFLSKDFLNGVVGAMCSADVRMFYRFCNISSLFAY